MNSIPTKTTGGPDNTRSILVKVVLIAAVLVSLPYIVSSWALFLSARYNQSDSWGPMRQAYNWFASTHAGTLYDAVFFKLHIRFQYPPSSLLLFAAASSLHLQVTDHWLNWVSWIFVWVEAVAVAGIGYAISLEARWPHRNPFLLRRVWLLTVGLVIAFYPVLWGYALGQVQTWLNAWFVLACLCWVVNRRFTSGLLIGAICLVKPQFILFLFWGLFRKQSRFLFGFAAILLPGELIALAVFGLQNHLGYLSELRFLAHHGQSFLMNQSVNGLLNRFAGNLDVAEIGFPPYNARIYLATTISSAVCIVAAMLYRVRSQSVNGIDFLIAGLTFAFASPIAWAHHYGFLPAAFVFLSVILATMSPSRKKNVYLLTFAVAFLLCAFPPPAYRFYATHFGGVLQSTLFFGVIAVLILLYSLRDQAESLQEPRQANRLREHLAKAP